MITKSCHDSKDECGKYCRIIESPKTDYSVRVIPLAKNIIKYLKELKKSSNSKYVISNNKIISIKSYQMSFELLLKKNKTPHKGFHALRHTFARRQKNVNECKNFIGNTWA